MSPPYPSINGVEKLMAEDASEEDMENRFPVGLEASEKVTHAAAFSVVSVSSAKVKNLDKERQSYVQEF